MKSGATRSLFLDFTPDVGAVTEAAPITREKLKGSDMAKGHGGADRKKNIAGAVEDLLRPVIAELGYELWDVVYEKEGPTWFLRVTIDKFEGITINDCELVTDRINPILDGADPIEDAYTLEVSSPGIERELRLPRHIREFTGTGEKAELRFFAPKNGKKSVVGLIDAYDEETDTLTFTPDGGGTFTVPRSECALIKTVYDFGE